MSAPIHRKLRVAVAGLRFGGAFAPIYHAHPDVEYVAICDSNREKLDQYGEKFGFERRYTDLADIVRSDEYDAVHLVTPIHAHAQQTLDVLNSGKHCACTVPMATTIEQLKLIVEARKRNNRNYMMMETAVYTYQFLLAKQMHANGEFGRIQFLRGAHYQDMENWPDYWKGLPPMHYATHAVSPLLAIADARATKVHCFGSGVMKETYVRQYGNPFPVETAIFQLDRDMLSAEVTRTLFETARSYMESFNIYGEKASMEWHMENDPQVLFRMGLKEPGKPRPIGTERISPPSRPDLLPPELACYITHQTEADPNNPHQSVLQGNGHHGSHPHLVHEFIRSIMEERKPSIDAVTAANWTAAGICAHESAMNGGVEVMIPSFD
ncbi:Gfo/Idh/MocA family oxidoreductase [Paenibacillus mesophilus]|uniref:Gfo/Idh/MocA family protein n=1 Tax=Paenibacillus mesophilus TaxID=2582849 RepID=UPI00110DD8CA|nr:Gfo/Idh/MocA family oxidoreductase [Paenibacillus mesophilus]TMV45263.1 Gfo/Idh/MocA family oxidoreductase [Paenibacillus mesophilus]